MTEAAERAHAGPDRAGAPRSGDRPPRVTEQDPATGRDVRDIQRRSLWVLMATVAVGGAGTGGAFSIVTVLAEEITGSETLSGIAAAGMTTGAALAAVPLAKLMARSGRRVGLRSGYLLALAGALLMLVATAVDAYALVVIGMVAVGTGSACGLAARFAVVDLATPADQARTIGLLVGATTAGAIAGPTLATGPATTVAAALGLEDLAGPFLFAAFAFAMATLILDRGLHPDPLLVARRLGGGAEATRGRGGLVRSIRSDRTAAPRPPGDGGDDGGTGGHGVDDGYDAAAHDRRRPEPARHRIRHLDAHRWDVRPLAPGGLGDRAHRSNTHDRGRRRDQFPGCGDIGAHAARGCLGACSLACSVWGSAWNCCLVAGTALFSAAVPAEDRVPVQGAADLLMSASGGIGGIAGGAVVAWQDFQFLSHYSGLFGAVLAGVATLAYFGSTPGISRQATLG